MLRLHTSLMIKIVIALSICFLTLQFVLMVCACKCNTIPSQVYGHIGKNNEANNHRDNKDFLILLQEYQVRIKQLNEKIIELEANVKKYQTLDKYIITEEFYHRKKSLNDLTFLNSYIPKNEHEVIPFNAFNSRHIFGNIGYLSKRPQGTPIGQQASELREVLKLAIGTLNRDVESNNDRVSIKEFVEGVTRNDFMHGTVYDLYFRSTKANDVFRRIKLFRPFDSLQRIGRPETIDTTNEMINIIIPLSGRIDKFKLFMERVVDVCIRRDKRVFITVVYFGINGRDEIKNYFLTMSKRENFDDYKVIFSSEDFNRGKALQKGAESWTKGNVLMFFCDVDIYFDYDFLERCRLHTSPGSKAYYPIVFSQYNPEIIYGGISPPKIKEQINILSESGFWRDFGFGMTCQYKDDFFNVGGFDLSIKGWGGEDVALYKQYLRSSLTIVRAYDPNIFHIYHAKNCIKTLSDAQFISCLQSKSISEGSHKQLGMLAFGSSLINGKDPEWRKRLQASLNEITNEEKVPMIGMNDNDDSKLKIES